MDNKELNKFTVTEFTKPLTRKYQPKQRKVQMYEGVRIPRNTPYKRTKFNGEEHD